MHRLTHRARRLWRRALRRHDSEHGAVATLLAVLLSTGVFFGVGALVIDVTQISWERTELQTGADAASWAIALNCATAATTDTTTCTSATQTPIAQTYAKQNTKDGTADAQICFYTTTCSPTPTWNTAATCRATSVTGGQSVEVRTSTRTGTGTSSSTLLPPSFAGALAGTTYTGRTVGACGRVAWGPPVAGKVLALGISKCDWKRMTGNGTIFVGPLGSLLSQLGLYQTLGLPAPTAASESAIPAVLPAAILGLPLPSCTTPVNLTEPRGWTWLFNNDFTPPDSNCEITLKVGDLPRGFVLGGITQGITCANRLAAIRTSKLPVLVPIFDQIQQTLLSLAPTYRIAGFAPFVVTGYTTLLPGVLTGVGSLLNGNLPGLLQSILCGTSSCILGYFTKTLVPVNAPVFGTGPNYGATVIGRTG